MANPSTTGPSGAGTEVLRRAYFNSLSNTDQKIIDGVANHIYTILSVIFCERVGSTSEVLNMFVDIDDGGTDIHLMAEQAIPAYGTFVWDNKFIITATDALNVATSTAATVDCYITYIDQEFA